MLAPRLLRRLQIDRAAPGDCTVVTELLSHMKSKLRLHTLVGLLACNLAGYGQTNPPAGDSLPAAAAVVTNLPSAAAPAETPATPVAAAAPAPAVEAPAPVAAVATQESAPPTNASDPASAVIPLIAMDDVALTDAIRNFARQAGVNYMLDPKIGFGQPGPDGRIVAQPTVSLRWENITAEQALNALLNNYSLQAVEDPKTKIVRITVKDPAAKPPLITKVVQLKYTGPTNVVESVRSALQDPRSKVLPDVRTSQLVLVATETEIEDVEKLVQQLDTPTKQVLIEARLLETSANPKTSKGIDWSGTFANQNFSFGNGFTSGKTVTSSPGQPVTTTLPGGRTVTRTPGSSSQTGLETLLGEGGLSASTAAGMSPAVGFLTADGVHGVLSFLNANSDAKVLAEPRTVTLDNETATLSVTRANPIMNVTAGTVNTAGGSTTTYTNLGVILIVTPRISANKNVNLKVMPEVSRYFDTVTKTVNGVSSQADRYDFRKIETHVMIPSGHTLVLGGLMQDDIGNTSTKVPILGDLPVIGAAFRSESKARQKSNLLIFITPTIVEESDFQVNRSTFLQTPVSTTNTIEPDWSAWDTTKPYDWKAGKKAPAPAATAAPPSSPQPLTSPKANSALNP